MSMFLPGDPHLWPEDPLDRGLIVDLRFDRVTGSMVPDFSGTGPHGTGTLLYQVATRYGPALGFDGGAADRYVMFSARPSFVIDVFTLEAFVYMNGWGEADAGCLASKENSGAGIGFFWHTNQINTALTIWNGPAVHSGAGTIAPGNWYHFITVVDGTNVRFWINGVNTANPAWTTTGNLSHLSVGNAATPAWNRQFDGDYLLFRWYDRILVADEVRRRYEICTARASGMADAMMPYWGEEVAAEVPRHPAAYNTLAIY